MKKVTRDLKSALTDTAAFSPARPQHLLHSCALSQKKSCCQGLGYHIDDSGPFIAARLCSCVTECPSCYGQCRKLDGGVSTLCRDPSPLRITNIINASNIPARYHSAALRTFSNFGGNGREVITMLHKWVASYKHKHSKGILIEGPVGVGKTYLLAALGKELAQRGVDIKFVDFFQLLNRLKLSYASQKADEDLLQPLIDVDVLLIDEMGKGRNSDFEISVLDQLVMGRYNQNKVIIASTNYKTRPDLNKNRVSYAAHADLTKMRGGFGVENGETLCERVGERIYSRLVETTHILEISGEDFRLASHREMPNATLNKMPTQSMPKN